MPCHCFIRSNQKGKLKAVELIMTNVKVSHLGSKDLTEQPNSVAAASSKLQLSFILNSTQQTNIQSSFHQIYLIDKCKEEQVLLLWCPIITKGLCGALCLRMARGSTSVADLRGGGLGGLIPF